MRVFLRLVKPACRQTGKFKPYGIRFKEVVEIFI
jgi:hypothetical protein